MTGFLRALRGEVYVWSRRRSVRFAVFFIFLAAAAGVLAGGAWQLLRTGGGEPLPGNFWPRFAQGARLGLVLAEVLSLLVLSVSLPREVGLGAARDPLVRHISRPAFLLARSLVALLLPLFLGLVALAGAGLSARLLYAPGPVLAAGFGVDPEEQAALDTWLREQGLDLGTLAEWNARAADQGDEEAWRSLGREPVAVPEELLGAIPFLVFREAEVRREILLALARAVPPLLALGALALFLSTVLPTGVLALGLVLGACLGALLLFGSVLAGELGERAWWCFADWLPGLGHASLLEQARQLADGYSDVLAPPPEALTAAWQGSLATAALLLLLALPAFQRRSL